MSGKTSSGASSSNKSSTSGAGSTASKYIVCIFFSMDEDPEPEDSLQKVTTCDSLESLASILEIDVNDIEEYKELKDNINSKENRSDHFADLQIFGGNVIIIEKGSQWADFINKMPYEGNDPVTVIRKNFGMDQMMEATSYKYPTVRKQIQDCSDKESSKILRAQIESNSDLDQKGKKALLWTLDKQVKEIESLSPESKKRRLAE